MRAAYASTDVGLTPGRPVPRFDEHNPCGRETALDLTICLILASAVVGLLLLAL